MVYIKTVQPFGRNGTMFTECCGTAICNDQLKCPSCKKNVIGFDAANEHERGNIRWANATRFWPKDRYKG